MTGTTYWLNGPSDAVEPRRRAEPAMRPEPSSVPVR
jgi:hypothetical protein